MIDLAGEVVAGLRDVAWGISGGRPSASVRPELAWRSKLSILQNRNRFGGLVRHRNQRDGLEASEVATVTPADLVVEVVRLRGIIRDLQWETN